MSAFELKIAGAEPAESRDTTLTGRWLPIKIAADRSGFNLGALRRRVIEEGWEARGLARLVKLTSGQKGYEVDEGADPRFAVQKSIETIDDSFRTSSDFLKLPQVIRDRALQRERIIKRWQTKVDAGRTLHLPEGEITKRFILELNAEGVEVSRATLFNWLKAYRTERLKGLVDQWGKRTTTDTTSFWQVGAEAWLHPNKLSALRCFDIACYQARQPGCCWEEMSYRDFCRKLKAIPAVTRIKRREGEDAFVLKAEPSITRDYTSISSNEWWNSDDHTFDVMIQVGIKETGEPIYKRPTLHAWQDVRSRKIVAWTILPGASRASDVLRTFVAGCREHGVPQRVLVDNGKVFDARSMQGITKKERQRGKRAGDLTDAEKARVGGAFTTLGVDVTHATPYHGQSKPIERFFGTLCSRFSKLFEAYTGPNTVDKPGKGLGTTATQKAIDRGDVLTLEEFRAAFSDWLANDYNGKAGHLGDGMDGLSPDAVYAAELVSVRRVSDEVLEFATFERFGPVTVHKNGVTWNGLQFGWASEQIINRLGEKVLLAIDERDVSHVYVLDVNGGLICRAEGNQRLPWGADKRLMGEAKTLKKKARRADAEYMKRRTHLVQDVGQLAAAAARERRARQIPNTPADNTPPSVRPVITPFDNQSAAIQRALEGASKTAVGAESVTGPGNFVYRPTRQEESDE